MATIIDVAQRARVSISTVSYALSGRRRLSRETRNRILKVAKELGYYPSAIGTALATGRTRTIGITVTNVSSSLVGDAVAGIEEVAWKHGYSIILCNTYEDPEREAQAITTLMGKKVDGMILVAQSSAWKDLKVLRQLKKQRIPVVVVNRKIDPSFGQSVMIDNYGGAHAATLYLISLGHRRIGFLTGPRGRFSSVERLRGYKAALKENGIPVDPDLIARGVYGMQGLNVGYSAAISLLRRKHPPTAIFTSTDGLAMGVLRALRESALDVPTDVSVIGYDNTDFSAMAYPALTSVAMPMKAAGTAAAESIFSSLDSRAGSRSNVTVACELIVRESTGRARGGK